MGYVVGRGKLRVGEEDRYPGQPVPEAADWPNLRTYLRNGTVVLAPDANADDPRMALLQQSFEALHAELAERDRINVSLRNELDQARASLASPDDAGVDEGEAAATSEPQGDAFDITVLNADQAKAWIAEQTSVEALQAQLEREKAHAKHQGGRLSTLRSLSLRIAELQPKTE